MVTRISIVAAAAGLALSACTTADVLLPEASMVPDARPNEVAQATTPVDGLITKYAKAYEVPETLVRRVVKRESNFRPEARNGPYWGLMQILPQTARTMGHAGPPAELLDAETNLKYAVKYLRGAYLVADGNHDRAVRLYASGYYYDAKRKGLLVATGLKPGSATEPEAAATSLVATAPASAKQSAEPVAAFAGPTPTSRPGAGTPAFN